MTDVEMDSNLTNLLTMLMGCLESIQVPKLGMVSLFHDTNIMKQQKNGMTTLIFYGSDPEPQSFKSNGHSLSAPSGYKKHDCNSV